MLNETFCVIFKHRAYLATCQIVLREISVPLGVILDCNQWLNICTHSCNARYSKSLVFCPKKRARGTAKQNYGFAPPCLSLLKMKGTYIGFQSMAVSILDHVFKYRFGGLLSGAPENRLCHMPFLPFGVQKGDFCLLLRKFQPEISLWALLVWKR